MLPKAYTNEAASNKMRRCGAGCHGIAPVLTVLAVVVVVGGGGGSTQLKRAAGHSLPSLTPASGWWERDRAGGCLMAPASSSRTKSSVLEASVDSDRRI